MDWADVTPMNSIKMSNEGKSFGIKMSKCRIN